MLSTCHTTQFADVPTTRHV
ncbi:hypothetical protein [Cronobacter sakazakii]|nr:hypothetical protein [Cronobacter sakazakii]